MKGFSAAKPIAVMLSEVQMLATNVFLQRTAGDGLMWTILALTPEIQIKSL
jgi:hypothetical protein